MKKFWGTRYKWDRDWSHGADDIPYQYRAWLGRLRYHVFYRGDRDPDFHDHPWWFVTFPLNSYVEEVVSPVVLEQVERGIGTWFVEEDGITFQSREIQYVERRVVKAFRFHFRRAKFNHRIVGRFVGWQTHSWGSGAIIEPPYALANPSLTVRTIVWRGKKSREWGFLKNRLGRWCWEQWESYHSHSRSDAACND